MRAHLGMHAVPILHPEEFAALVEGDLHGGEVASQNGRLGGRGYGACFLGSWLICGLALRHTENSLLYRACWSIETGDPLKPGRMTRLVNPLVAPRPTSPQHHGQLGTKSRGEPDRIIEIRLLPFRVS